MELADLAITDIEVTDIEAALASAPRVRSAAAVMRDGQIVAYVVPGHNTVATSAWRDVFKEIYKVPAADDAFDARGWVSSIDGTTLADADMREWRDTTIAALRREPVGRVLEVGCGNGLLATELVPECVAYVGTDIVAEGLDDVRARLEAIRPGVATLHQLEATEIGGLDGPYDTIVFNSVIQYFPDARYLVDVLEIAAGMLSPTGRLFVGDVRHQGLADLLYTERALARLEDPTPAKIARVVRVQGTSEGELLVDPAFFAALGQRLGAGWRADVEPKRGRYDNELSRYRYDVTISRSEEPRPPAERDYDWSADGLTPGALREILTPHGSSVLLRDVPNARFAGHPAVDGVVGVHPEDLVGLARERGYECRLSWANNSPTGAFDAYLSRTGKVADRVRSTPKVEIFALVRDPKLGDTDQRHRDEIRAHVAGLLPAHLVPRQIVVVDALPMTADGRLDRAAPATD